jgi:hypothetical protein
MFVKQSKVYYLSNVFWEILDNLFHFFYNLLQMMLVGCRHRQMGKPLTIGGTTYRICRDCGAYRLYDLKKMRFDGDYFYRLPAGGRATHSYSIAESLLSGQIKQAG